MKHRLHTVLCPALLCLLCLLTLGGCRQLAFRLAPDLTLPDAADVTAIRLTGKGLDFEYTDPDTITDLLAALGTAVPTREASIQDAPGAPYIQVDFQFAQGVSTLYLYQRRGSYYLEQPYQGIYRLDAAVWQRLTAPGGPSAFTVRIQNQSGTDVSAIQAEYYCSRVPTGGMIICGMKGDAAVTADGTFHCEVPAQLLQQPGGGTQFGLALVLTLPDDRSVLVISLTEWDAVLGEYYNFALQSDGAGFTLQAQEALPALQQTPWSDLPDDLRPPEVSPWA